MKVLIDKDTLLYGSFSISPGNNGCIFFNKEFKRLGINAIYKSFYSNSIVDSFNAAKTLGFKGFAVSMPFKVEIIPLLDRVDSIASEIGAVNTVVFEEGESVGYNTDYFGVNRFLKERQVHSISIAGNGGFSKAIQFACKELGINFEILTRWDIENNIKPRYKVFNATPVDLECEFDGRPYTEDGKTIARYQAEKQLELYVKEK